MCATCGGERPPARHPRRAAAGGCASRSFCLPARSRLRGGGGAASGRGTQTFRGELSSGCEVTFLQADAIGWHAPSPVLRPAAHFPLLPASPARGLGAHPPPPPFLPGIPWKVLCLPRSEEGAGGSSGGWLAWLPVFLTFLRADRSLPSNFLFRGKSSLQPKAGSRGGDSRGVGGTSLEFTLVEL